MITTATSGAALGNENLIQATLDTIAASNILAIAAECRQLIALEYESNPPLQSLENVKLFNLCSEQDLVRNVAAILRATSSDSPHSALMEKLKLKVHTVATAKLNEGLDLNEIIDLACTLRYIGQVTAQDTLPAIFSQIIKELTARKGAFDRDNSVWALFALRKINPAFGRDMLFKHLCSILSPGLLSLNPLQLSLVGVSLVQASYTNDLLSAVRMRAIDQKANFTVNETVNTLWAYCYKGWKKNVDPSISRKQNMEMIEAFQEQLIDQMGQLSVDQAVRIAWTFKNMNITDKRFFSAIKNTIQAQKDCLTFKALENIVKNLCQIKEIKDDLLINLLHTVEAKQNETAYYSIKELISVTYHVLMKFCERDENVDDYEKFIQIFLKIIARTDPSQWDNHSLLRLNVITAIYGKRAKNVDSQLIDCLSVFLKDLHADPEKSATSSQFHKDVASLLGRLLSTTRESPRMINEFSFAYLYSVDIAFPSISLAIEVDGHCHFDEQGRYMSGNILKETLLTIRGWNLVRISHQDWYGKSEAQKRSLLKEKLSPYLTL